MHSIRFLLADILVLLLFSVPPAAGQSCRTNASWHSSWNQCDCAPAGAENSMHIICHQMSSATIPPLPPAESGQLVVALSMTDGTLSFIQQDAFKGQEIQTLDFSNNHIQTINVNAFRGIEMKLSSLNLRNNNLSVIPSWAFTYLHQLQFLHMESNRILHIRSNTFDETQLNSLQFLHLDNNQIQLIPKMAFHRMRLIVLTLANNRISTIEKMSLPQSLSVLDLRNNFLIQIPFLALKDLADLQTLNFEGNRISTLEYDPEVVLKTEISLTLRNNKIPRLDENSFRSFRKLRELDLSYNQISKVYQTSFETVSQMKNLDLSYNTIAYMQIGTLKNFARTLERLNLEENLFHTLPDALRDLHNLTHLNMNGNKLNSLNEEIFMGFQKTLTELLLAYNQLTEVPSKVLYGMQRLQHLDLSKNRISNVERLAFGTFDGTGTSLVFLNLAGNQIRNISDPGIFLYMNTLAYLDLSYNFIESIGPKAFEKLPELEKLFLQNNRIQYFPQAALTKTTKLRHLVLDGNRIASLPPQVLGGLPRMEHLSLANNLITHVDNRMFEASSARGLKSLNLDRNRIEFLKSDAFANLESLQHLRLSNNLMKTLSPQTFNTLKSLRFLDLSGNRLVRVTSHTIYAVPLLETLMLNNNEIEWIEKSAIHLTRKIEAINLSHNRQKSFDCDCLGEVTEMATLDLSYNNLTTLELSCVKRSLKRLNMAYNNLQSIRRETMQNFEQLQDISLSHNGILEIQSHALKSCPKLSFIDLSHNHIRTIWRETFVHQERISHLDLSHNSLMSIQRGSLGKNNLYHLDLSNNELQRIPIDALETTSASLASLVVNWNRLKMIDSPQLVGLRNLSSLSLSSNVVESVEEAAFEHLTNLRRLDISHNPITSWSPTAFRDISHSIVSLNLAATGLFSIPKFSHRGIRNLNISWNNIHELTKIDLSPISKLSTLDISFNSLKKLESSCFEELFELKHLNISGNHIQRLDDEHFRHIYQLDSLYMTHMPSLVHLPAPSSFAHLTNLKELRMYECPNVVDYNVSAILKELPPLRTLHIEVKEPVLDRQLHLADKRLMRELSVRGEAVKKIEVGAFHGLRGYRFSLEVTRTSISNFPHQIFNILSSVNFLALSLANNRMETFDPFKSSGSKMPVVNQHGTILHSIKLSGNKLRCDCGFWWLSSWLSLWPEAKADWESVYCDDDESKPILNYYGFHLSSFTATATQCDPNGGGVYTFSSFIFLVIISVPFWL